MKSQSENLFPELSKVEGERSRSQERSRNTARIRRCRLSIAAKKNETKEDVFESYLSKTIVETTCSLFVENCYSYTCRPTIDVAVHSLPKGKSYYNTL